MREHKYRAWDIAEKRFWSEEEMNEIGGFYYTYRLDPNPEDFILFEYIGLQDKNKKDMYEGDIVQFYKTTSEVFFRAGSFATYIDNDTKSWIEISQNSFRDELKIIGNICQNPELIKER